MGAWRLLYRARGGKKTRNFRADLVTRPGPKLPTCPVFNLPRCLMRLGNFCFTLQAVKMQRQSPETEKGSDWLIVKQARTA